MMSERHPEARHVATDRNLFNPFAGVERRSRGPEAGQVQE
jgi:hypothetical protein